ncbi:hypothetical protein A9P82_02400 [Arachidicoccus ginsenosidimutans]|uniref:hypothetical protein n=1 Tax=Arachidicoccus sp. BS20 TaxID=1850526 RepID=UPI0007F0512B|nr:hypothetical protein [Arachidicoccus sp. BS20]ANI88253.1 hypothetical protein A9P82_02400 [Arachidicoccus sp. BS20]
MKNTAILFTGILFNYLLAGCGGMEMRTSAHIIRDSVNYKDLLGTYKLLQDSFRTARLNIPPHKIVLLRITDDSLVIHSSEKDDYKIFFGRYYVNHKFDQNESFYKDSLYRGNWSLLFNIIVKRKKYSNMLTIGKDSINTTPVTFYPARDNDGIMHILGYSFDPKDADNDTLLFDYIKTKDTTLQL